MIEITLGLDLNYEKAKTITLHNTYLFVSDEIYQAQKFLKDMDKVFSVKDLNLEVLKKLN
jgi:flagellin-specific chaperone FliS